MKVLVTGGTGFLGSALVRHLLAANYEVRILARHQHNRFLLERLDVEIVDGDVTHPGAVDKAVQGCDIVFDLAAVYTFYPFWEKKAAALYRINVQGAINLLEAALRHKVKRFIHTSTIAAIGKRPDGKPSDEESGLDFGNASHYARSKYLAEQEVLKFCKKGLPCIILNPGILIGERDYKPTPSGDVIVKFLNRNYPAYFDTLWSIADVDDVAKAHVAAIDRGRVGERYILCHETHLNLKEIFQILEKVSGVKAPRIYIPDPLLLGFVYLDEAVSHLVLRKKPLMPSEGIQFCRMAVRYNNSKAVKELGYTSTPIEETLAKAVSWYRKNAYVKPRGILRIKAGGSKLIASLMGKLGMDKLTDKLNLGTFVYYLSVKLMEWIQKIGFKPKTDGWRKVTQCYLRTEHSKFALAVFGLDYWSDVPVDYKPGLDSAKRHLAERLAQFFKRRPITHFQVQWHKFHAEEEVKKYFDVVLAEFDDYGHMKSLEPYLDLKAPGESFDGISPELKAVLVHGIINHYNKTKDYDDKKRPLLFKMALNQWLLQQNQIIPEKTRENAKLFIHRILSANYICFEILPVPVSGQNEARFHVPSFIKCKHPGFGLLNILCRFTADLKEADLWIQYHHVPIDGVPAQEVLNDLKKSWGRSEIKFPTSAYDKGLRLDLCSTRSGKEGVYHVYQFVDFQPFLKCRRELNRRFSKQAKESITSAALFIWKLAQYEEFEDIKFAVPIDLGATESRKRTLGFIFIRPGVYFDQNKPDRGFFRFQQEFNRQIRATRKRKSVSYKLLETYAIALPLLYAATIKLFHTAMTEFVGSLGITVIKKADFFISPSSDVHRDGFIAFSNFSIPSEQGKKVGVVSIKGPQDKIMGYVRVFNDIMNRAIKYDEFYF